MHEKLAYILKHNSLIQSLYRAIFNTLFRTVGCFVTTDAHLILFSSYGGEQYSDSPKAIYEALLADERYSDYRCVWAFEDPKLFSLDGCEKVKIDTIKYFLTALRAKVWITNVNIERGLNFKKKQSIYLNTWHGTGPKKAGNAVRGRKDYDFSYVDILCVDGPYLGELMKRCFNARGENMLWCGRPREDELLSFSEQDAARIRSKLAIPDGKKVLLYMPTWREYENRELDWDLWREKLSKEYVLLVRTHHFSQQYRSLSGPQKDDFFIDVSSYPDVNELYWVSDILISDYSSAFFDYGLLGRPMISYAYDYERFDETFGLLMDLKREFPNGIMRSEKQIIDFILSMDYEAECVKAAEYCKKYVSHSGNATKCCLDRLWSLLNGPKTGDGDMHLPGPSEDSQDVAAAS